MVSYMNEAGIRHKCSSLFNQDAITYKENEKYFVMALADGISACKNSRQGARVTCDALAECLMEQSEYFFKKNQRENVLCIIGRILHELEKTARKGTKNISDYSSTSAAVLIDKKRKKMYYFNLGDSLIMATKEDKCSVVSMPSDSRNGCYSTTTANAEFVVDTGIIDIHDINSIVICSDGAWRLMYENTKLYTDVRKRLIKCDYNSLKDTLMNKERLDDCSFISYTNKQIKISA